MDESRILENLAWLRRVALQLVGDPHLAEDAVQDTVLVALSKGPTRGGSLRGWLASVLRNRAGQQRLERERRIAREERARPPAESPDPGTVVEELALHRRLSTLVEELEEPYRTTLLLRFLRESTPNEIARELDVPLQTVHTRIRRGLERLRERFERELPGDSAAWAALLAPVLPPPPPVLAAPDAGLGPETLEIAMKTKLVVGGGLAAGALLGLPFLLRAEPADGPEPLARDTQQGALVQPPTQGLEETALPALEAALVRTALAQAEEQAAAAEPAAPVPVRGLVCTLEGAPVADVRVIFERSHSSGFRLDADGPRTTSAGDGTFELPLPPAAGRLSVDDPYWAAVVRPHLTGAAPLEALALVLVPARECAGRVLDAATGEPIAEARVEVTLDGSYLQALGSGVRVEHLKLPFAHTLTDADGAFHFSDLGCVDQALVAAVASGYDEASVLLSEVAPFEIELRMGTTIPGPRAVHGIVVDALGGPVARARVAVGSRETRSDASGRFAVEFAPWSEAAVLTALVPGLGATSRFVELGSAPGQSADDPLRLELPAAPHAIRGRVLDAASQPVADALVWTPDTSHFGDATFLRAEGALTGPSTVEALLRGEAGPMFLSAATRTDASGAFELLGLQRREYAVFAMHPRSLAAAGPQVALPDAGALLLTLAPAPGERVAGRVVSRKGLPLAGVQVVPGRSLDWEHPRRDPDPWASSPLRPPGASWTFEESSVYTDAEGRFELEGVERAGMSLSFRGEMLFLGPSLRVDREDDPLALQAEVDARSTFRVVLSDAQSADTFKLGDEESFVPLFVRAGSSIISAGGVDLIGGRSGLAFTREGEHTIVFSLEGVEVRRERVLFPAGGPHQIEL